MPRLKFSGLIIILSLQLIKCDLNEDIDNKNNSVLITKVKKPSILEILYDSNLTLIEKLHLEETTFHWYPYRRLQYYKTFDGQLIEECPETNHSINDFPDDVFTQEQRLQGAIVLHFVAAFYFFSMTAVIINDYFLPSVQCICDDLGLTPDVAAATFMATATTMPEFFANTISTFLAESDMGIGNVVGSLMFNMMVVAAIIGFVDKGGGKMSWYQSSRDCLALGVAVTLLTGFGWDGIIMWWEALIMFCFLPFYYLLMFQNERIQRFVKKYIEDKWNCCSRLDLPEKSTPYEPNNKISTIQSLSTKYDDDNNNNNNNNNDSTVNVTPTILTDELDVPVEKLRKSLWRVPEGSKLRVIWWAYTWPIKFVLTLLIPSPKTFRRIYPLSFIMCIVVIAGNSYLIVWMLTIIGYTLSIPESVMGLTFLSFGGCLPELFAGLIMALKGKGGSNFSNSLGTNSLSVLFSLSFPWFLSGVIGLGNGGDNFVQIGSYGMEFIILSLLVMVIILYITVTFTKFHLTPISSCVFIIVYGAFLTLAILIEIDIIMPSNC